MLDVVGSRAFASALRPLEPRHQIIVDALVARAEKAVPIKDLVGMLYGARRDGGPETATNIVAKIVFDLRRRGFRIITMGWGGYAFMPRSGAPIPIPDFYNIEREPDIQEASPHD